MTSVPRQRQHIKLNNFDHQPNTPDFSEPPQLDNLTSTRPEELLNPINVVEEPVLHTNKMQPIRDKRDFAIGLILLFIVVILWTASNFVTQDLFEDGFDKPFLVTYLNTAAFAFYLIPFLYRYWRYGSSRVTAGDNYEPLANEPSTLRDQETSDDEPTTSNTEENLPPLTTRETAMLASIFCFLWFIANWSVNASLRYTTVGSSTVLASTSGLFTMVVGRLLGIEALSTWKITAVIGSFVGVLLVSLADSSSSQPKTTPPPDSTSSMLPPPSHPLLGDALALLSAAFYAFYLSLLKVRIKTEERVDMQLFFGFVGLFNILACWPMGVLLHITGIEPFRWPVGKEWTGVVINMAVTFSSDFIYVIAMLKTTPLVVTLGLTLTIPLAILGDLMLKGRLVSFEGLCGALLVIAAFGVVGWEDSRKESNAVKPVIHIPGDELAR